MKIQSKIRSIQDDIQMSFAADGEEIGRFELWKLILRQLWLEFLCSRLGHKGDAQADGENGGESFSCSRCGYSRSFFW